MSSGRVHRLSPICTTFEYSSVRNLPKVSVIIPCRNEGYFIGKCLNSIIANDYPKDRLEVLIIDGMSEDKTRITVEDYANKYVFIKLLDNPKKITPAALNVGIANATGDIIMRMDAHSTYPPNYISGLVGWLEKTRADNVGGVWITVPATQTLMAEAIALALSHAFGVGNAYFRIGVNEPRWVDTVPFGCYRRDVFDRIGRFDERLVRNQDIEFNTRLRKVGGKVCLVPDVHSSYHCRPDLRQLWVQNFQNGQWNIYTIALTGWSLSWRHFLPLGFVAGLIGSGGLAIWFPAFAWLFGAVIAAYFMSATIASLGSSTGRRASSRVLLPLVFLVLHLSYGLGSLWGITTLTRVWRHDK